MLDVYGTHLVSTLVSLTHMRLGAVRKEFEMTQQSTPGTRKPATRPEGFRIAGFAVRTSPSVLLLFAFITFTAANGLLPASAPGASTSAYWAGGIVASAFLFASLLVHELAHAIVARRHGITVESITFWLFGGVSRLNSSATAPRSEWRIAASGPMTNLVLGAAGFGVAAALSAASAPAVITAVAGYVASINVLLAVFNLLPAAPLDGGRILRAILWRRHGDRDRATVTAAKTGQVIGMMLVGVGVAQVLFGSAFSGIWTGLIGFFLAGSAGTEARQTATQAALAGLRVRDVLPVGEPLPAAPSWHTVDVFMENYRRNGDTRTVLPVQGFDGMPAGLVGLANIAAVPASDRDTVRLSSIAAPLDQIAVTDPDELLLDLLAKMRPATRNIAAARLAGNALVLRDGQAIGVVTPSDFARAMQLGKLNSKAAAPASDGPTGQNPYTAGIPREARWPGR
jgi:Zn-dependent protease